MYNGMLDLHSFLRWVILILLLVAVYRLLAGEFLDVDTGVALGHPLGASGTKLMTTLLHELERSGGRYGLQTMCEGGGQANVTIIERL